MEETVRPPTLDGPVGDDGWLEERVGYLVRPRPKSKFKTTVDPKVVFGRSGATLTVTTRVRHDVEADTPALEVHASMALARGSLDDRFECIWDGSAALRPGRLRRTGMGRDVSVDFSDRTFPLPTATYPEVLLPFLLRGQPRDDTRRALYSWTSDLFVARVYYETRGTTRLDLHGHSVETHEVWMYPDLNDWIALGGILTKLAKPLLPRYSMWYETAAPHRVVRFEGPFGPPGAPEIVIELAPEFMEAS